MPVWDDILSDHDQKVLETRRKTLGSTSQRRPTGFGERPALLVVDMNIGAVGEDRPSYEQMDKYPLACGSFAWTAIRLMQPLISAAREASIPVIYTKQIFKVNHGLPMADDPTSNYGELSPLSELQPEIAPQDGDLLIEKSRASPFFSTPLLYILMFQKVDTVIIAGNSTSGCVRAAAVDASYYPSFKVAVVEECVFDRYELSHKAALFDMGSKYCDLVTLQQSLDYLERIQAAKAETALV